MPRTKTKHINFQKLQARGKSAVTVVKLMMACNDLSLTNQALSEWRKEQPRNKKSRQTAAGMYFVRTQIAHLFEGLKVIEAIQQDSTLFALIEKCDNKTQESFEKLKEFLPEGSKRAEFEKLAGRVRHNLAFHYDKSGKLIEKAIADRATRPESQISSVTRGDTAYLWHFKVADDVVDSIVVRQIWNIPRSANLRFETDQVADYLYGICLCFADFSGEFIWKYCGE